MRYSQVVLVQHEVIEKKDVDINCARSKLRHAFSSHVFFNGENCLQYLFWIKFGFYKQHLV